MFSFPMVSGEFYQTDLGKKLQPLASCDFFLLQYECYVYTIDLIL